MIEAQQNQLENTRTIEKINITKSWFFENVNETDKPLARLITGKKGKSQHSKIRKERSKITTDTTEIHRIIRKDCEGL